MTTGLDSRPVQTPARPAHQPNLGHPGVLGGVGIAATALAAVNVTAMLGSFPMPGVSAPTMPAALPPDLTVPPPGMDFPTGASVPALPTTMLPTSYTLSDSMLRHLIQTPLLAFVVAFGIAALLTGRFGSRLGSRSLAGILVVFGSATAVATISGSDTWLLTVCALQGLAAGVVVVSALKAVLDAFIIEIAQVAFLAWIATAVGAIATGPYITGLLVGHGGWTMHTVLWVEVGIAAALAVVAWWAREKSASVAQGGVTEMIILLVPVVATVATFTLLHPAAWKSAAAVAISVLMWPIVTQILLTLIGKLRRRGSAAATVP